MNPFLMVGDQAVSLAAIVRLYLSNETGLLHAVTVDGADIETKFTTFEEWALHVNAALEQMMSSGFSFGVELAEKLDKKF